MESSQLAHLQSSLATFRASLESFAFRHKSAIASNPVFRAQFHSMCVAIGVDPLACHKGFWSQMLGLGDFYFELGVQIMDICIKERPSNGGIMKMEEVLKALRSKYKHQQNITLSDESDARHTTHVIGDDTETCLHCHDISPLVLVSLLLCLLCVQR